MLTLKCLLAFAAVCVGLVQSWDVAVSTRDQLYFYKNKIKNKDSVTTLPEDIKTLTYDGFNDRLLYAGRENGFVSIYSYNFTSEKQAALYRKPTKAIIISLGFDPFKEILFWTEATTVSRSMYSMSIKPGTEKEPNLLMMNDDIPSSIAVDTHGEYIYWTNSNTNRPTIERSHYNGTKREEVINSTLDKPISIAFDQQTNKIYWLDVRDDVDYTIRSAELNGKKERNILNYNGSPYALTISKDAIYWIDNVDNGYIWQLPTNFTNTTARIKYAEIGTESFMGIAANNPIMEQKSGQDINSVAIQNVTVSSKGEVDNNGLHDFCVYGTMEEKKSLRICNCSPGYIGERCDVSACHNFCLHGSCSLTEDGQPLCRCDGSYTGERCDVDPCRAYCLNNGKCSLDDYNDPTCQCEKDYEGFRCERVKIVTTTTVAPTLGISNNCRTPVCNCPSVGCDTCHRYCLNQGECSLNEKNKPICHCTEDYEGSRCETVKSATANTTILVVSKECPVSVCNCSSPLELSRHSPSTSEAASTSTDTLTLTLSVLAAVICLVCLMLITMNLQGRPTLSIPLQNQYYGNFSK